MAITGVNRINESSATDATSYTTTGSTGSNSKLFLIAVVNSLATTPATPTLTHAGGLTCVQVETTAGANHRLTIFRALKTSGVSSATFTANAGETATGWIVIVDEFDGVDTSGTDGSGAIVQAGTPQNGSGTTATGSLAAFGDATNNAAFMATVINSNAAITHEVGYTELGDIGHSSPTRACETEFKVGEDTAPTSTFTSSAWRALTAEIKAAAAAATEDPFPFVGGGYFPVEG